MVDVASFQNGAPPRSVIQTQIVASRVFGKWPWLRRKIANAGQVADFLIWSEQHFDSIAPVAAREDLWETMAARVIGRPIRGIELGVAWGYGTAWWVDRLSDSDLRWDGLDRFTGLPRAWRDLGEGHFNAAGNPPAIDDERVRWHVGDVEDRIGELDLSRRDGEVWVVMFDLDIYEPSLVAWRHLRAHLRPGDLLFFDEAFDRDERHLLEHQVLPAGRFELIGITPVALALAILEIQ